MQNEYHKYTGYGINTDESGNMAFMGTSTFAKPDKITAFIAAQMTLCFARWLHRVDPETTAEKLLEMLIDNETEI